MTLKSLSLALATTALVALNLPVLAEDAKGPNVGTTAAGTVAGAAATMTLAQDLYALGVAQGDALTVLAAAKLAASVAAEAGADPAALELSPEDFAALSPRKSGGAPPVRALSSDAVISKATSAPDDGSDDGAADGPVTADQMFAKATELAGDDDMLIGLIEDAQAEGSRGRIGGAVEWLSRLPAGQTDVWEIPFYGNSYAEIAVAGDGDADLDVAVTDENGNVICYDVSYSDRVYCDWTPSWDGYFYVTVQNMGGSRNSYYLLTN